MQSKAGKDEPVNQTDAPNSAPELALVVSRLAAWLQSMRSPHGYTGPVAHWWQNCLQYTGIGIDWRYEGIITGYLNLFQASGDSHWLERACHAANDLVHAQLPDGSLRASCFELNPHPNGTPHEVACALALLRLIVVLQAQDDLRWQTYLAVAGRIVGRQLCRLWDASVRAVRDAPDVPSFVPNKAATLAEAIMLLAQISHSPMLVSDYAVPILDTIIAHQLTDCADPRYIGAIYQNSFGSQPVPKFFPLYIARCIPALALGTQVTGEPRYQRSALHALAFVLRWRNPDGSFPQVLYPRGRINPYPYWIAATGDILRAMDILAGDRPDAGEPTRTCWCRGSCRAVVSALHTASRPKSASALCPRRPICATCCRCVVGTTKPSPTSLVSLRRVRRKPCATISRLNRAHTPVNCAECWARIMKISTRLAFGKDRASSISGAKEQLCLTYVIR